MRPVAVHQRRWDDGRTLQRAPLGPAVEAAFGAPYYHFHRGDLAALLAAALPRERAHAGHRLVGIEEKGDRVIARFENGASAEADVLVGADGIHSRVRDLTFGPEKPRFTGCAAWRGLVPAERIAHLDIETASHLWMGPGGHCVHYWVSGEAVDECRLHRRARQLDRASRGPTGAASPTCWRATKAGTRSCAA